MFRALAFTAIFATCTAAANAQSCSTTQGWQQAPAVCIVRLANGVCQVLQRVTSNPQVRGACMGIGVLSTLSNVPSRPYHPYQPPISGVIPYTYTPPRLPQQLQQYVPTYPRYGTPTSGRPH
jgi:hypothetical protein